ncbi:hypothetical protein HHK36_008028 [Tetracentron sinense]|uniref:Uncharacterized protein n=1 Tax=Tetracentron sinense TaxID=13715 RepID=A0A834ZEU9_TETSI|nr:hypothetical protein HHK36_008028 [Tetracentron sinense]
MAFISFCSLFTSSLLLLLFFSPLATTDAAESNISSYIVHTSSHVRPSQFSTQDDWYTFMINTLTNHQTNIVNHARIFYTYSVIFHGFAAVLTAQEAEKMAEMPGVTGVLEDKVILELHTTRTPDFLGLNVDYGLWPDTDFGDNVIIGLVDSGIWPESNSFNDDGLGPIPKGWKGTCEEGTQFNSTYCNKKLIGARLFFQGIENKHGPVEDFGDNRSPRDGFGHGTHTASTAAGTEVAHANLFGFAGGNARGIATKARIAMYKACFQVGCSSSDILAAMESAIEDGVNVLSLSLGSTYEDPYYSNVIAIGAFAAVKRNIFVTCSAGNSGPQPFSVVNAAPWITTVGAGSIDRTFPVQVQLGNGKVFVGSSLYPEKINTSTTFPLVYLSYCSSINIIPDNVMGKIVVCDWYSDSVVDNGFLVEVAGGVGLIQVNDKDDGEGLEARAFTLPSATVGYREGLELLSYINTTKNPTASFVSEDLTVVGKDRAPIVASFSSRGPNSIVPELLKPDIIAPGFNIIAAWPTDAPPSLSANDPRSVQFNIISGTSMACPHVAGVAALLYAAHPDWSPAAIRSALMTSSVIFDNYNRPIARYEDLDQATLLGLGAGHINPQLAADPGLVYDADISDYINFLCSLNYTQEQLKIIVNETDSCLGSSTSSPGDLNYPSFSVVFKLNNSVHTLKRTVTQVGVLPETYTVKIMNPRPEKVAIRVDPQTLTFGKMYEKQSYTVEFMSTFVAGNSSDIVGEMEFGYIIWESDKHSVRSPVALMWN